MNTISNIEIIADNKYKTTFEYELEYINNYSFKIIIHFLVGTELKLTIYNKYDKNNSFSIDFNETDNNKIITSPFELLQNTYNYIGKIPKIIHQSYTKNLAIRLKNATHTWKLMNNDYEYKYWDDELADDFIYENFDDNIKDSYFSLYARAYKSDILRLCILYVFGGIWTDISSECLYSFDKIMNNNNNINIVLVKDNPSQITNGNIYQAFIAVEPKNDIIKYILDITIDRVLNFNKYDTEYPWIHNETIAVTGPTIFAIALNKYLNNNPRKIFTEQFINYNSNNILLLEHNIESDVGYIFKNNTKFIKTKYENYKKDRTTIHYSTLFTDGYIIKKKIPQNNINNITINSNNLFQIWINNNKYDNNYVTDKMFYCYNTWINKNPEINYIFLNNSSIINLIKNETEFPLLLEAYNKLKVFAFKSDLIRYYLMYKFSGTYVDIDSYCINNIRELTNNFDIILSYDIDKSSISQAFIHSNKPNLYLFKLLVEKCIENILNKNTSDGDLSITGPKLFGKILQQLFNYVNKNSEFTFDGLKIKIINYYINLPLPKGSWINNSINYSVNGYTLTTFCKSFNKKYIKNVIRFVPRDILRNVNGKIVGNTKCNFSFSEGSGFYVYNDKIFIVSKYSGYNKERYILGGNDFAIMYQNNDLFY
jgi:mannosyltransferase OCH1-like enzyme